MFGASPGLAVTFLLRFHRVKQLCWVQVQTTTFTYLHVQERIRMLGSLQPWFSWRLRWLFWKLRQVCCCRRGPDPIEIAVLTLDELRRLQAQGRLRSDIQVYCYICEVLCRDIDYYADHMKGQKHYKRRRMLLTVGIDNQQQG